MLDAGAFLRALEYGADCTAVVLGKPSAAFFAEEDRLPWGCAVNSGIGALLEWLGW